MPDLIAAVATGAVRSAIGIIRLSGDGAIECADRLFQAKSGVKMADAPSNKLIFGRIHALDGALLDTGMCTVSRAPRSYTGEDTAELQCHGSPAALGSILAELFKSGARQALPGEFTKRAFLNGKLDLTQAEAVVDLIDADTESSARNAAGQLGGAVARRSGKVYSNLLDIAAHFHAVVDWPDEDIEDFRLADYLGTLDGAEKALSELLDTFERGKIMRGGAVTVIVGRPNVGKSSLLNALLGFDRAIVTDIPGTTRDTVEETCVLGGVKLRLTDTAGLRDTGDAVERIGVERSYDAMERAMLIFAVLDASEHVIGEDLEIIKKAALQAPTAIVLNKSDLPRKAVLPPELEGIPAVSLSAVTGEGIGGLADIVTALLPGVPEAPTGEILTNARQAGEVRAALESVRSARAAMLDGVTPDAVLTEIESAMEALGRLTGRTLASDVTDRIFHRFCVGK